MMATTSRTTGHPSQLRDTRRFQAFPKGGSRAAIASHHRAGLNHTSDQHAWFQAARAAPPGSPERAITSGATRTSDIGARIIFVDAERSNWTWDPVAKAYYWHRFFHHQPDLNYDNPAVLRRVLEIMDYWMAMGVDGFRLDAVPYLVEREGTKCESLPETHDVTEDHPTSHRHALAASHAPRRGQSARRGRASVFRRR